MIDILISICTFVSLQFTTSTTVLLTLTDLPFFFRNFRKVFVTLILLPGQSGIVLATAL